MIYNADFKSCECVLAKTILEVLDIEQVEACIEG